GIAEVHVDTELLRPLEMEVDPEFQRVRKEEKEQIRSLNDKFASFIEKVGLGVWWWLRQERVHLWRRWELRPWRFKLWQWWVYLWRGRRVWIWRELWIWRWLRQERVHLWRWELRFEFWFEEEINKRTSREEEFVELKKELDGAYMGKEEMELRVEILGQELQFLRCLHQAELSQLQTLIENADVVVSMENPRELDTDGILQEVRREYEGIARKSRAEVDSMYRGRFQDLQKTWENQQEELRKSHEEMKELSRNIQRLQQEIESAR
ncbi:K2CO protein, partial [Furnarius figulus]|nr:K2CO protein [Furnarius figulus]